MAQEERESEKAPATPSETVKRLRETFAPLAASLHPEDEPATTYAPGPVSE